jgi:lysozyme family protein
MSDFQSALQKTLTHEGGYQNDPNDSGNWYNGINYGTKYGITAADMFHYFPALIATDVNAVRNLTIEQAGTIYAAGYWKDLYSQIVDQSLAEKLFDMGVLMGVVTAVKLLQISMQKEISIVTDGDFGPETLADVNAEGNLADYKSVLLNHAVSIIQNNPKDSGFIRGWIDRINS